MTIFSNGIHCDQVLCGSTHDLTISVYVNVKWRNQKENPTPETEMGKLNILLGTKKAYRKPSEQLFPNRWPLNYQNLTNKINTET